MLDSQGKYRRNGKNVYIKQPELKELKFVSELWDDEDTMKDIGGVFKFPESKWEMFFKKMVYPTDGKNFYCLVYTIEGKPVGEASFHGYDSATKIARFNIKIHNKYRNKGYGEEAIKLLLEYFFFDFGGEVIMDNISTKWGMRIANKLGFEMVRQYKEEVTVRLSKEQFLSKKEAIPKNIALLMYKGMNLSDFALAYDIFGYTNNIREEKIFNSYPVSFGENVVSNNGFDIYYNEADSVKLQPDVIFIPGGVRIKDEEDYKEIIEYIMANFDGCDYICAQGEGIDFLVKSKALEGMFIPKGQVVLSDLKEIDNSRVINRSYIDNGKIMLSSDLIGEIELLLNIINKIGGIELAEKVREKVGFKRTLLK